MKDENKTFGGKAERKERKIYKEMLIL